MTRIIPPLIKRLAEKMFALHSQDEKKEEKEEGMKAIFDFMVRLLQGTFD